MLDIGSVVGEYKIEKLVGQGGMGQVYGAVHPVIGKRAAIKVLRGELCSDPEAIDRFVLEARAVNQIGHPNIVDVFAFGALPDGRQYMVMEWLRGESLDQRIRRMLPTLDETCEILLGICAALDAAHAEHIIHRDLKPHNVFLSHARGMKPSVKLLDFGLVKLTGEEGIERTRSGSMLGTPAYMSPEQARGRGVDHRTDLYALGVMMFELATGTLPFVEQSAMEMVMAHLQFAPPAPSAYRPDLPPLLDHLILGLLEKDPANRPTLAYAINVLTEVRRLVEAAPVPRTGPAAPTLVAGHQPRAGTAPALPPGVPGPPAPVVSAGAMTALSTPAHALPSVVPMPIASAHPTAAPDPAIASPPPATGRRVALSLFGALVVAGIAFAVVFALRATEPQVASPDAMRAAPVATPDAAVTAVTPDAAIVAPGTVDAAVVAPVADAAVVQVDARPKKTRSKTPIDAGVAIPADAAVAAPPDAAVKPIDDGDGLLPMKGGSR